jgi:hypothetical protein
MAVNARRNGCWISLMALALTACAGNGEGLDSGGQPLSEGGSSTALSANFNSIQTNVFTPVCTACHAGASAPVGLRLDEGNSYNLLVGIPSTEVPGLLRVRAGDPDNSYLIQKLEGRAAVGAQMPLGGPPLPVSTIAFIRQWIADGAIRPAALIGSGIVPLQVSAVAPADGDQMAGAPAVVVVGFTNELDATRIDDNSVRLERLADADSGTTQLVAADVVLPLSNSRALVVTPHSRLAPGRYRITVTTESGNEIADLAGQRLSGVQALSSERAAIATFSVESAP